MTPEQNDIPQPLMDAPVQAVLATMLRPWTTPILQRLNFPETEKNGSGIEFSNSVMGEASFGPQAS